MPSESVSLPGRRDPTVQRIVASWRRLTGGSAVRDGERGTLIACSGGADSSALLLALASVPGPQLVAHVVHDLRPAEEARADRDTVEGLCGALGVGFRAVSITPASQPGNAEANARRERYGALARLAEAEGLAWVATGHHADDQLETVLMRLVRGSGVRGLGGIRPRRGLSGAVTLVRPMLGVTHNEACELCARCGWVWREDATNTDERQRRAAIRARVIPELRAIEPSVARLVSRSAGSARSAHRALAEAAEKLRSCGVELEEGVRFDRDALRAAPAAVLEDLIRGLHAERLGGSGQDALGRAVLTTCIGVIGDDGGGRRELNTAGMWVAVTGEYVTFS